MFSGFSDDTIRFLDRLGANNQKPWFDAHRAEYEAHFLEPAKDFITDIAPGLRAIAPRVQAIPQVNGSIFRINRDIRFSRDKTPYKDHLDMWFWEGDRKTAVSGFFLRLTKDSLILGAGAHMMTPDRLKGYRAALADSSRRASLLGTIHHLETTGLPINGQTYKRQPPLWQETGDRADQLILHSALFTDETSQHPASLDSPDFINHCLGVFQRTLPLHRWLIETLA